MTAVARTVRMTAAESFWYVLGCISFGAMYFAKVPVKKALSEAGLAEMTGAEQFWYVVQCIALGAGYFYKVPVKKALSELAGAPVPYDQSYRPVAGPQHGYGPQQLDRGQPWPTAALPDGQRHARHDGRNQQGW